MTTAAVPGTGSEWRTDRVWADLVLSNDPLAVGKRWKVRVTIFSGPDFKTPALVRGAMFENFARARAVWNGQRGALMALGIPTRWSAQGTDRLLEGSDEGDGGVLPARGEDSVWPTVG